MVLVSVGVTLFMRLAYFSWMLGALQTLQCHQWECCVQMCYASWVDFFGHQWWVIPFCYPCTLIASEETCGDNWLWDASCSPQHSQHIDAFLLSVFSLFNWKKFLVVIFQYGVLSLRPLLVALAFFSCEIYFLHSIHVGSIMLPKRLFPYYSLQVIALYFLFIFVNGALYFLWLHLILLLLYVLKKRMFGNYY